MSVTKEDPSIEVKFNKENEGDAPSGLLADIIQKSLLSSDPLLQKALKQEQAFRAKTEVELTGLFASLGTLMSQQNPEQVKKDALEKLATDNELIIRLNKALEAYQPKDTQPK